MPRPGEKCDPKYQPTLDHVVPRSEKGADDFSNFLLMHMRCNAQKGSSPPTVKHLVILEYVVERIAMLHHHLRNGDTRADAVRELYEQGGAVIYNFKAEKELREAAAAEKPRKRRHSPRLRRLYGVHAPARLANHS